MVLVFTICSNNYLAQAVSLGKSLINHNPDYLFIIGLIDRKIPEIDYSLIPFEVLDVETICIPGFQEMFSRYNIVELNTAVKPFYFKYLISNWRNFNEFAFLDPDILVYSSFSELEKEMESSEIIIIPHITSPIDDNRFQAEEDFLNSGLYNLGFIGLKRGEQSEKLLEWWAKRLSTKAFINFSKGMFTDQIWINFVPLFFDNVLIYKHPGYNMAYWNLHERSLSGKNEVIKDTISYNFVFYHFSGFDPLKPEILSKYQDRYTFENRPELISLFENYSISLFENGFNEFVKYPCYYTIEKQKIEINAYRRYKNSIPICKRIMRGIILRFIKFFNVNVEYYTT